MKDGLRPFDMLRAQQAQPPAGSGAHLPVPRPPLPVNTARRGAPALIKDGRVLREFLGIAAQNPKIPSEVVNAPGLPAREAVEVAEATPGSPAKASGMR